MDQALRERARREGRSLTEAPSSCWRSPWACGSRPSDIAISPTSPGCRRRDRGGARGSATDRPRAVAMRVARHEPLPRPLRRRPPGRGAPRGRRAILPSVHRGGRAARGFAVERGRENKRGLRRFVSKPGVDVLFPSDATTGPTPSSIASCGCRAPRYRPTTCGSRPSSSSTTWCSPPGTLTSVTCPRDAGSRVIPALPRAC